VAAELVASLDGEPEDGVEAAGPPRWKEELPRWIGEMRVCCPGSRFETR